MKKRKLWIPIVAVVLAAAVMAGVLLAPRFMPKEEVAVYSVAMVGYTDYYSGTSESYGMVTTDKVQPLYVSTTQTITEILVYPGQSVKKGDVLYTYDTTLSDLAVERKALANQQLEMELKTAQEELQALRKMKPIVYKPGSSSSSTTKTDYTKSPSDKKYLNTVYSTKTTGKTSASPLYFWLQTGKQVDDALIAELFAYAASQSQTGTSPEYLYVVFQMSSGNRTNTAFTVQSGVKITKVYESIPVDPPAPTDPPETTEPSQPTDPSESTQPSQPSDPSEGTQPSQPTDPSEGTQPSQPTDPSEGTQPSQPTDPTEGTQPSTGATDPSGNAEESEDPTDPSGTAEEPEDPTEPSGAAEEPEDPSEPTGEADNPASVSAAASSSTGSQVRTTYSFSFFAPPSAPSEDSGTVEWNDGYTSAELASMKKEKEAEIKQLQFEIKMGKAELKIMQKEADDGKVVAQFDGVVGQILDPTTAIETGEPLMKVTGGGGYYVEGTVSELALETIEVGQLVTVNSWDTGMVFTGTIVEVGEYPVEEQNYYGSSNVSYYPYQVFIDESADLQEGYYVSMTHQTAEAAAGTLYIQNAFLRSEGNRTYVFVRNAEGLLEKRYLSCGVSTDGYMTPVYSGITEEDFLAFPYGSEVTEGAPTFEGTDQDLYGY